MSKAQFLLIIWKYSYGFLERIQKYAHVPVLAYSGTHALPDSLQTVLEK